MPISWSVVGVWGGASWPVLLLLEAFGLLAVEVLCHAHLLERGGWGGSVSYTYLPSHETPLQLVCRLLL